MKTLTLLSVAVLLVVVTGVVAARQSREPPPVVKPEGCEYQWNGTQWSLVDSNCPNGTCVPPGNVGQFVGQTVYKACTPNPDCGCQ